MLRQTLSQRLQQKLSPQQIQLMKLLQLPTIALEQRIKEELEINPALEDVLDSDEKEEEEKDQAEEDFREEEVPKENEREDFALTDYMDEDEGGSYKLKANNSSPDDERREVPVIANYGFHDLLESQLGLQPLSDHQFQVARYLIGNIDEDGYLRRDLDSVIDDIAFTQNISTTKEELEAMLKVIQSFDPPGVGARNLQECLLLQLERKPKTLTLEMAKKVIQDQMEEFSKKHFEKIARHFDIPEDDLKSVIQELLKLNPKPGGSMADSQKQMQEVIPDFVITNNEGKLDLTLNSRNMPDLRVAKVYSQMLEEYAQRKDKMGKEAVAFVKQKIESARAFIDTLNQRQHTLMVTMQAIMNYQKEYFLTGDETALRPMILKDISEQVGLDISTISRVSNSKYVQTQFGTFLLKSFFSESLSTDSGEEVSSREVKKILQDSIESENKKRPLTDDALAKILKEKGYNIARRTVAKYREQLGIAVARLRKQI